MIRVEPSCRLRQFRAAASGATAVEFAILSPLYLMLFLGMTAYGIYFGAAHSVQQISADTARAAVAGIDTGDRETIAGRFVADHAGRYMFIDPDRLSVVFADNAEDPSRFDVTVTYDARHLPIWGLFAGIEMPGRTIVRRATIRVGGV